MSLIRWKPWHQLDDVFENFSLHNRHAFDLATDVYEKNGNVIVKMHVPEIDTDKIDIKVEGHHLHVSGVREEKKEINKEHYYHREIRYGSFERTLSLPCKVNEQNTTAEFKDGILTITLPKKQQTDTKKITVTKK